MLHGYDPHNIVKDTLLILQLMSYLLHAEQLISLMLSCKRMLYICVFMQA